VACIFQEGALWPHLSVYEHVAFGLRQQGLPETEIERRVRTVLGRLRLAGAEAERPAGLSLEQRRRLALARALAVEPEIILMDEPFSALDISTRERLRRQTVEIWRSTGKTIIFVTHDVDESVQLADRILVFTARPGRIREIVPVGLPHPRDLGSPEYGRIKNRLYELLGVTHTV
jgi:NitT/TauT family transport system ATP-binding protein